jgi:DNA-binding HxlR family transcriptional regulator
MPRKPAPTMATATRKPTRRTAKPTGKPVAAVARTPRAPRRSASAGSSRPVMILLELLGRRWTMRVLWELREHRFSFRVLQEACDNLSPAVLNARLRELRDARLVDLTEGEGYGLSPLGRELVERFAPIVGWAERWAKA